MYQQKFKNHPVVATEKIIGRKLPCSIEAEKALLGALLLNDEHVPKVLEMVQIKDFYTRSISVRLTRVSQFSFSSFPDLKGTQSKAVLSTYGNLYRYHLVFYSTR